jgi:hypothetical protein
MHTRVARTPFRALRLSHRRDERTPNVDYTNDADDTSTI